MHRDLNSVEFTIFDTETTGLDPSGGDRIVEIAGIRFKAQERISVFQSLVNPGRAISEAAYAVNHITPEMLKDAPVIEKVLPRFIEFSAGSCLCSYNAAFDMGFLNNEMALSGLPPLKDIIVVDLLTMARRLLPGLERYALWFVAQKLQIDMPQQHRAFSDVELTWEVFHKLKSRLKEKGIFDLMSLSTLFGINSAVVENIQQQKIARIQEALDLGAKIRIRYLSAAGAQVSEREVLPKQIRKERERFYLVGYCYLRKEERSFRVDSILNLELV